MILREITATAGYWTCSKVVYGIYCRCGWSSYADNRSSPDIYIYIHIIRVRVLDSRDLSQYGLEAP